MCDVQLDAMPRKDKPSRRPRRRRTPEEARQELLAAAERVFGRAQPDEVGLKEVAREAGVSHALVTHYFGTYAGLIEAVLDRRIRALRAVILERLATPGPIPRPAELLDLFFAQLEDPIQQRLMKWLIASERPAAAHAFALRDCGLQLIAQRVAAALVPGASREVLEVIELALLTAVAAAYGYVLTRPALAGALGRPMSPALDADLRRTLAGMFEAYLRAQLGPIPL